MRQILFNKKILVITICCCIILNMTILPTQAKQRSHGLAITLFVTGIGLKVGSTFMYTSAEKKYEEYLNATVQSEIQSIKDDVVVRKNASISMSRVGYGFIGLATILSIFNQLHDATIDTVPSTQLNSNANISNWSLLNLTPGNYSQVDRNIFSFLPHYDFYNQRVSLKFLHRF